MPEKAEPTILRDIGELLALLWTLMFEPKDILKMMDHLMNQNRKLDRCFALPAFRQIDGVCGVIVEGKRIALGRCCLIGGGEPCSGRTKQCSKAQRCHLPCRHEPQNRILTDRRKIEFSRKPGFNHWKQSLAGGIAGVSKVRLRPNLGAVNFGSCDRWESCRLFGLGRWRHCHRKEGRRTQRCFPHNLTPRDRQTPGWKFTACSAATQKRTRHEGARASRQS
jgi:hypothetical protein